MNARTSRPAATETGDPYLLTPGPLTTSATVKQAMQHDLGSRDDSFIALTARVRRRLAALVNGEGTHSCVLLQGAGTYAVEAMLGSLLPRDGHLLNLVNGAYGRRITRICEYLGRKVTVLECAEDMPVSVRDLGAALDADPSITHVAVVHCETTSGIRNPLEEIARVTAQARRVLLVDAMSTFGALPIDVKALPAAAVAASSNKCLEGVPGVSFCIASGAILEASAGNAHSLSLDLHEQWRGFEGNGQWRFTPPVQVLLALDRALTELEEEGGIAARERRYRENCRLLVDGMRRLGFRTFLDDSRQAPVIVTFFMPEDADLPFSALYDGLKERGYVIYPGKLTGADTFRIGCIGRLGPREMEGVVAAVGDLLGKR
jgi:2-aminoethylphosphonate-pyruvate transaminase